MRARREERRFFSATEWAAGLLRRMAPVAVAALFTVGSCSDSTGPSQTDCRLPTTALPEAALLGTVIVAEWQRVGANMPQHSSRDALARSLTALSVPLNSGRCASAQAADARAAITPYKAVIQGSPSAMADLDAVELGVDAVQRFLDGLQ